MNSVILRACKAWRGGRAVECAGLENHSGSDRPVSRVDAAGAGWSRFARWAGAIRLFISFRPGPAEPGRPARLSSVRAAHPRWWRVPPPLQHVIPAVTTAKWWKFVSHPFVPSAVPIPSVSQRTEGDASQMDGHMDGFDGGDREVLSGQIAIQPATRERLVHAVAAIILGQTPEEITEALEDGEFVPQVAEMLARPHEADELSAHVDLLLGILQSAPVPTPA